MATAKQEGIVIMKLISMEFWPDGLDYVYELVPRLLAERSALPHIECLNSSGYLALRHDVDHSLENALNMAKIEYAMGIRSSYYLLHPDGRITENYFGRVESGKVKIKRELIEGAKKLIDLGHEVGVHNDIVTLSHTLDLRPANVLDDLLSSFARANIDIKGTAAHGSKVAHGLGLNNNMIFKGIYKKNAEQLIRDKVDSMLTPTVESDLFNIDMGNYGLTYEAYSIPRDLYITDSSAKWHVVLNKVNKGTGKIKRHFGFAARKAGVLSIISESVQSLKNTSNIVGLIHACHWNSIFNDNPPKKYSRRFKNLD